MIIYSHLGEKILITLIPHGTEGLTSNLHKLLSRIGFLVFQFTADQKQWEDTTDHKEGSSHTPKSKHKRSVWPRPWSHWIWACLSLLGPVLPGGSDGKESACNEGDLGSGPGSGRARAEGNGNPLLYSQRIPWTEDPGGLQPMGLQRVGHDWATNTSLCSALLPS